MIFHGYVSLPESTTWIMGPYRQQFVAPHADPLWWVPGVW